MRVVLDTNVIIAAFLWTGTTSEILELLKNKQIIVYTCPEQIIELSEVLKRPKFRPIFKKARLKPEVVVREFFNLANLIKLNEVFDIIKDDPFDNVILSLALNADAQFLISGDKHLLSINQLKTIRIVKPEEFLKRYQ